MTVVRITHHMDEAARAQRLVVMDNGHVGMDGPPAQVFQNVVGLRRLGLEVPDSVSLLYELRQAGLDVPLDVLTPEDCAQALAHILPR